MDKLKILITGSRGYVAKSIIQSLKEKYDITGISRNDFDLRNYQDTSYFFKHKKFDCLIHCAISGGSRLKNDDISVLDDNLRMYYNLLDNEEHYNRFINIGSGAEYYMPNTPYGMSKKVINQSISGKSNFYNLRIYGVFDENELDTRFIKSNINRYINKIPIEIHADRAMDFFYMQDFVNLIDYYVSDKNPKHKDYDCVYEDRGYSYPIMLSELAEEINKLSNYKVPIKILNNGNSEPYISYSNLKSPIDLIGIKNGIKSVYNKLKWKK